MVGLLPLCAATTLEAEQCDRFPEIQQRFIWFIVFAMSLYLLPPQAQ